ncbi:MAG: hemerythrin domain-containing protein [Dehalococcoidia bacterium]|nr:hemerythrin domain-containing protein [Dehalococcoidia bacterium]
MSETLAIVEQILDEHKQFSNDFQSLSKVTSDVEAATKLGSSKTKDYFVPKSLDDHGSGVKQWKEMLDGIDHGLRAHFEREETALSDAFKREGTPELAAALAELMKEHDALNKHVAKLLKDADDIASGGAKIEVWEGSGWGMKTNIDRLRAEIEEHAEKERVLLGKMKTHLNNS